MNVGIYDTEHFETAYTAIKLFDTPGNYITVFGTSKIISALKEMMGHRHSSYQWIVLKKNSLSNCLVIYKHHQQHPQDLLLLNTVSQHHLFFALLCAFTKKASSLLVIHDAHDFFNPNLRFSIRSFTKYVGKKLLARNVDYYATLLSSTKKYIQEKFHPKQEILCLPGSYLENKEIPIQTLDRSIKIVTPGSIDLNRRRYEDIFQLIMKVRVSFPLELILLGAATESKGKSVIEQLHHLQVTNFKIISYKAPFVSIEEYDRQLQNCDLILAPLQKFFYSESKLPEEYGLTKSSGCFFDAIRFAKPLVINSDIFIPEEIKAQCFQYKTIEELIHFFEELSSERIVQLKEYALQNSSQFTLENIRERLPQFLFEENQ